MSVPPIRHAFLMLLLGCSPACGGKSSLETGSTAAGGASASLGGSNAGGSAGSMSASAGAPTVTTVCPSARPTSGSACNYQGYPCNYSITQCSSEGYECRGGVWVPIVNSDGAAETCINFSGPNLPTDGASCACRGLLDCTFHECDTTGKKIHAVCDNSVWHVSSTPCVDTPCGPSGLRCKNDQLCLLPIGRGNIYWCMTNPCAEQSETTACSCAGSLCGSNEQCSVQGEALQCSCPDCRTP